MRFKVELTPDEDGWFIAEVPALPGCVTQGSSREEAIINIKDAIQGWLHVRLMRMYEPNGSPQPAASGVETVLVEV